MEEKQFKVKFQLNEPKHKKEAYSDVEESLSNEDTQDFNVIDLPRTTTINPKGYTDTDSLESTNTASPPLTGFKLALLFLGLCLSVFLASLDATIITVAIPKITSDLHASSQITWIGASFLLTATAFKLLYGKLSDILGRKPVILFALMIFLGGSLMCGLSNDITVLIVARAITGVGAAGLMIMTVIIISDVVAMEVRATYIALIAAVFSLSSVVGPVLGGYLTDNLSWRWVFYINLPIGAVTLITVVLFLNPKPIKLNMEELKRLDYWGTFFLVIFCSLLVTGLTWGGVTFPWLSAEVISILAVSIVCLGLFLLIEFKLSKDPIIPSRILSRNSISAGITSFFVGCIFFVSIFYIPIYFQVVKGRTPTEAGLELLPFLLGVVFGSLSCGISTNITGRYRFFNVIGGAISIVGTCLLAYKLTVDMTRVEEIGYLALLGVGLGIAILNNTIICQACVEEKDTALSTSYVNFASTLGGVVGLAIQGALFKNMLDSKLSNFFPGLDISKFTESFDSVTQLQPIQITMVVSSYLDALRHIYFTMIPYSCVAFLATLVLVHIPLSGRK